VSGAGSRPPRRRPSGCGSTASPPPSSDRAREEFIRAYERAFAEREKTPSSSLIGEYVSNFLEGVPAPGIAKEFDLVKAMIPGITLDEVNAAGRVMSGSRGRILLVNAPEKAGLAPPDGAALLGVLEAVSKTKVTEYTDVVGTDPLVPNVPAPGRVTAETTNKVLGTTEWTLSNGVRVLLKPTDFKADEVLLSAWSPGGASLAPDKDWLSDAFRGAPGGDSAGWGRSTRPPCRRSSPARWPRSTRASR
jgi:zinc protease